MSVLLWQGIWLGSGGTHGLSAPEQAPAAGLDIMGLQGIWLGGFPNQTRSTINFEETLELGMVAGVQNSLALTIFEQLGLGSIQGLDAFDLGRIHEETLSFGSLMSIPLTGPSLVAENLSFGQRMGIRKDVEGGCGPAEVWEDLPISPEETWMKGPC